MDIVGSHFWFGRLFVSPLCCDAPFSNSIAFLYCSFSQSISHALILFLFVGVVLCCAFLHSVSWSYSFPTLLREFYPLAWPFRVGPSLRRVWNALDSASSPFCAQGGPCGRVSCWIDCCLALVLFSPLHIFFIFPVGASRSCISSCLALSCRPPPMARQQHPWWWIRYLLWLNLAFWWFRMLAWLLSCLGGGDVILGRVVLRVSFRFFSWRRNSNASGELNRAVFVLISWLVSCC